jgi:RNA polymerase sigma factor (sigma-70 family)
MVWGVCRRILPNHHDGEDAFQATFLVFVRKAASIVPREMVANWLYGVARQTAQKARATAIRRKARERQVREMLQPARAQRDLRRDLQPLLDEALSRLSEKYRAVIVLCDLEGKTRKEAARQLACPEGTVAGRLARARAMLAKRLTRRGVASDGALAAVPSGQSIASPELPTSLVASTIKAASLSAVGKAVAKGVISINVEAITEGVLKTMLPTKLKVVAPLLFVMGFVALPCGMLAQEQEGGPREVLRSEREPGAAQAARKQTSKDAGPLPADSIPSRDELHGKWAGEKNGIHVDLTLGEKQAVWKVEFVKTRKPKAPFQSPDVRVSIGADLRCDPDAKASCLGLYLPAYRGDDQQIKKVPTLTGRAAVGQIQRGAEGTIRLRIIPTGRENLDQEEYDYPAVEELILRRVAEASK